MKKLIIAAAVMAGALSGFAQGTVAFNNKVTGTIVSHVFGPEVGNPTAAITGNTTADTPSGNTVYTGTLLSGTGFTAQLWAAPGAGQAEGSLQPVVAATTTFRTGVNAGYIQSIAPDPGIPGAAAGTTATLQLRAWDNAGGTITSYGNALTFGKSTTFDVSNLGGGTITSPSLVGLTSFNIHTNVPEPSTIALAVMGASAFLIRRRKK